MSSATRRRYELANTILDALGLLQHGQPEVVDHRRVAEAETALSQRMQCTITHLCDVGITKARIAREISIDPAALSELAEGGTSRLGLESIWEAYAALESFLGRAGESLRVNAEVGASVHAELLGFSAHPDQAKVTGSEALNTMGYNILGARPSKATGST
jgi:hypothetical protein